MQRTEKVMTKDKALELALEALETAHLVVEDEMLADEIHQAITAIKQALLTATPLAAPVQEPDEVLLKFYDTKDYPSLVAEMERHIERLQAKLPKTPPFAHQRVREG
jgi:predicted ArsR family transcriptional regulator